MILSSLIYRTPSQLAVSTLKAWTVGQGTHELVRVQWDPQGLLDARQAAVIGLEVLLGKLRELPPDLAG